MGYDLWFVAHLVVAVSSVAVLASMRHAASKGVTSADLSALRQHFPPHRNWAARIVHLAPATGIILSVTGGTDVSFTRAWVGLGVGLYILLAFLLEARVLPNERALIAAIETVSEDVPPLSRSLGRRIDAALVVLGVLFLTMIVQF